MSSERMERVSLAASSVGIVGALLVVAALVWAIYRFGPAQPLAADQTQLRVKNLAELRAADQLALTTADWVDKGKGFVRVPIQEAMSLAVDEWRNPAAARSNLIARVEKATAPPPKAPEAPNPYE